MDKSHSLVFSKFAILKGIFLSLRYSFSKGFDPNFYVRKLRDYLVKEGIIVNEK